MKKLRVLVLVHEDLIPPDSIEGLSDEQLAPFKTEYDVVATLCDLGHQVRPLGVSNDLSVIDKAIDDWKPDIAFNMLEEFHGIGVYDQHVVSYLELRQLAYTGCNPRGLTLAHDKALSKKILAYHRIDTPEFTVFPIGRRVRPGRKLHFPLLVKSVTEEGSLGIAQASVVSDHEKLAERVEFVHRQLKTDAIAEQYIDGRELYVAVMGNQRLATLPTWEILFDRMSEGALRIATGKVKWDLAYQKKWGIRTRAARNLPSGVAERIPRFCKRVYRALSLSGYARMDLRLSEDGKLYLLEANPNPQLAYGEDFAESAHAVGIDYEQLIHRILSLGLHYRPIGMA